MSENEISSMDLTYKSVKKTSQDASDRRYEAFFFIRHRVVYGLKRAQTHPSYICYIEKPLISPVIESGHMRH